MVGWELPPPKNGTVLTTSPPHLWMQLFQAVHELRKFQTSSFGPLAHSRIRVEPWVDWIPGEPEQESIHVFQTMHLRPTKLIHFLKAGWLNQPALWWASGVKTTGSTYRNLHLKPTINSKGHMGHIINGSFLSISSNQPWVHENHQP